MMYSTLHTIPINLKLQLMYECQRRNFNGKLIHGINWERLIIQITFHFVYACVCMCVCICVIIRQNFYMSINLKDSFFYSHLILYRLCDCPLIGNPVFVAMPNSVLYTIQLLSFTCNVCLQQITVHSHGNTKLMAFRHRL